MKDTVLKRILKAFCFSDPEQIEEEIDPLKISTFDLKQHLNNFENNEPKQVINQSKQQQE